MNEDEALWLEKALHGDEEAFGFLIDMYQKPVFSLCYRMLGNSNDAEDAAQESFIRAYCNLNKYDPQRSFPTWLLSIASHYCIDRFRKRQLPTISTDTLPLETITDRNASAPERKAQKKEKEESIQHLINHLKPIDRAAIVLRYWHEYSEEEIAEALDLSVSAVKSRLYRSRQFLAKVWLSSEESLTDNERRPHESPAL